MKPTTKSPLTPDQICRIIKVSAKASVRLLVLGELRIEFGESFDETKDVAPLEAPEPNSPTDDAISDNEHETQTKKAIEQDEVALKEDRLALMLIEDPWEAEKLIASGELDEDDKTWGEEDALDS